MGVDTQACVTTSVWRLCRTRMMFAILTGVWRLDVLPDRSNSCRLNSRKSIDHSFLQAHLLL